MSDTFLDELDGGLVAFLRSSASIRSHVGGDDADDQDARIFAEAARQGEANPFLVYTQSGGHSIKHHGGVDGDIDMTLQVYAYAVDQRTSRALAILVRDLLLAAGNGADTTLSDGTKIKVCNGGVVDSGHDFAKQSSDIKRFWVRGVYNLLLG